MIFSKAVLFIAISSVARSSFASDALVARVLTPEGHVESIGASDNLRTPLGSLYKLFMFSYLTEIGAPESFYRCDGGDPEEVFCCAPGQTITRGTALAKSCSPYFSVSRLTLDALKWRAFWRQKLANSPAWLEDVSKLRPETIVATDELLKSLAAIRRGFARFDEIQAATLGTVLFGTARGALKTWGTTLRVKTYTWRDEQTKTRTDDLGFTGGFAGWLPDGSSIWVSRAGHGRTAFQTELKSLVEAHEQKIDAGCVVVDYFAKYPIESVIPAGDHPRGPVQIKFKNGNEVRFTSDGSLEIHRTPKTITISARLSENEYVARVLDREVKASPLEAARAFSVAIRTFLDQNSTRTGACQSIADSSHEQRVSPQPASSAALKIARWSEGLTLDRVPRLRYHSTTASSNRLSWIQAADLAGNGFSMEEILKTAYPLGKLADLGAHAIECHANPSAEKWLHAQFPRWRHRLEREPGFEEPDELKLCDPSEQNRGPAVFANLQSQEIFVPRVSTVEDQLSVLHEYLHIAFRHHPRGRDEAFVENVARVLQEEK